MTKAIDLYKQALYIHREIGYRQGEGAHLANFGKACAGLGDIPKAIDLYQQALNISREIGHQEGGAIIFTIWDHYILP